MSPTKTIWAFLVKAGLWVLPVVSLIIAKSLLFPFITGRNFTFRIIVEIIFALWVGLAISYREYRPRLTPLFKAVSIFVAIVFLADILGPNPYHSIFSSYERMEGFMTIFHLYLYFLMLVSMFRTRRDWFVFFNATLVVSVIVSYIALTQKLGFRPSIQGGFRVDGNIGNPTYLAAYLLFHIWLLIMLLRQWWNRVWLRALYSLVLAFELLILYFTATRGAVLGLAVSVFLFCIALVLWWPRVFPGVEAKRKWAIGALIALILIPSILLAARHTGFVQSSETLSRLTNFSFKEDTISARFKIWGMSWHGFLERPVLGWGQENYYLVFQKYFNPGLYGEEPWFDRSHNIVFDWLVNAGVLGLASYLALFAVALWLIAKSIRSGRMSGWEGFSLGGLFAAYFLQNLFVFDSLNTYFLFFAFLAYVQYRANGSDDDRNHVGNRERATARSLGAGYATSAGLLIVFLITLSPLHLRPLHEGEALIDALRVYQSQGPMDQLLGAFKNALSFNTFGDSEVRDQLGNLTGSVLGSSSYSNGDKQQYLNVTVQELRKEVVRPAVDVKRALFLGSILRGTRIQDPASVQEATQLLEQAIQLSPTKQIVYFEAAQLYLSTGNTDRALELLKTAWNLDRNYDKALVGYWIGAIAARRPDVVKELESEVPLNTMKPDNLYQIAQAYQRVQDFMSAAKMYAILTERVSPPSAQYYATYAAILAQIGRYAEARTQVAKAIAIDPSFKAESKIFLQQIQGR